LAIAVPPIFEIRSVLIPCLVDKPLAVSLEKFQPLLKAPPVCLSNHATCADESRAVAATAVAIGVLIMIWLKVIDLDRAS
jgi:hypothetical protein